MFNNFTRQRNGGVVRVTAEVLRSRGACEDQVLLFEAVTGSGEVDLEGEDLEGWCVAHATCFDWHWLAQYLLTRPAFSRWLEKHRQAGDAFLNSSYNARSEEHFRQYKVAVAVAFARCAKGCPDPTVLSIATRRCQLGLLPGELDFLDD